MIEQRVYRDDEVRLYTRDESQQTVMNKWPRYRLYRMHRLISIAQVKYLAIQFRVIANGWTIELDSLAQRKTAILHEHIDDDNFIG